MSKFADTCTQAAMLLRRLDEAKEKLALLENSCVVYSHVLIDLRGCDESKGAPTRRAEFNPRVENSTDYAEIVRRLAIHYYRDVVAELEKQLRKILNELREFQI